MIPEMKTYLAATDIIDRHHPAILVVGCGSMKSP
jgi:hypothetical protein